MGRRRCVQQRQHLEEVALEGEITHDEGPGQTELAGRPEQPPNGVGGPHLECAAARRPEGGPVPELEPHRRRTAEEVGQEGRHRGRHTDPGVGLRCWGLVLPGPQRARPGDEVRFHVRLPMKSLNCEGRPSYGGNGRHGSGNKYASEDLMSDEHAAEPPPGNPGQRALGAMESAVRRARETAGAPPLPPPPSPAARPLARPVDAAPPPRERPSVRPARPLADPLRRRRGRPRGGGRHRVDRVTERQLDSSVLDRGGSDPHQHGAAVSPPSTKGQERCQQPPGPLDHLDHRGRCSRAALRSSRRWTPPAAPPGRASRWPAPTS